MPIIKGREKNIALIVIFIMLCATFTSCVSKPATVEELINSNKEIAEELTSSHDNSGMTTEIKDNEIIYSYDLSGVEGATEENLKEKSMLKILNSTLDGQADSFTNVCKQIEEESEISGVTATVNYTYNGEVLATKTFSSAGEVDNAEAENE
ncbi:MAG: DUF4854 domain-containing protein [Mogibacterium sp.]|nr:DUF4854 domain-containing protein [Mogibacterium sp.]